MPLDGARKDIAINAAVPETVHVSLHTAYPPTLLNEISGITRQTISVPRASGGTGTQTCTGSPVCYFIMAGEAVVAAIGVWDSATFGDGNLLAFFDNANITVAVNDRVDVNSLVFTSEDVAGK